MRWNRYLSTPICFYLHVLLTASALLYPAATGHAPTAVITTASGLLLFGGKAQSFQAADAATGKVLWSFPRGQSPTGSPMSYAIADHQYFAIAAGNDPSLFR